MSKPIVAWALLTILAAGCAKNVAFKKDADGQVVRLYRSFYQAPMFALVIAPTLETQRDGNQFRVWWWQETNHAWQVLWSPDLTNWVPFGNDLHYPGGRSMSETRLRSYQAIYFRLRLVSTNVIR